MVPILSYLISTIKNCEACLERLQALLGYFICQKMVIKLYQVDAFTNQLFGGNPAAVCQLESWLPDSVLQQIAIENNLSETAFFIPLAVPDVYELRWFTPELEIDLCGHATLATAHVIFSELSLSTSKITFKTRFAGELFVEHHVETSKYKLDFPARPTVEAEVPISLYSVLGSDKTPTGVFKARDHMLVYEKQSDVEQLKPNFSELAKFNSIFGIIVTAPGDEVDFVSRYFTPGSCIPEDPVTGSTHCSLIPYWSQRLNKKDLHAYQLSARRGELWCKNCDDRVWIMGEAITFLRGEIII